MGPIEILAAIVLVPITLYVAWVLFLLVLQLTVLALGGLWQLATYPLAVFLWLPLQLLRKWQGPLDEYIARGRGTKWRSGFH